VPGSHAIFGVDDEARPKAESFVAVAARVAGDPCRPGCVVGGLVDVAVDPDIWAVHVDRRPKVGGVASAQIAMGGTQAVRMRRMVCDDDGRAVMGGREHRLREGAGLPVHDKDLARLDAVP
jgi:hypothetical protein